MIVLRVGRNVMYSQCTGQAIHAQSSGESEFYGNVSGISAACGLQRALEHFGVKTKMVLESDSSAARAVLSRTGVGKIRHLAVSDLWVQEKLREKAFTLGRVAGNANPADMLTKHVERHKMDTQLEMMNVEDRKGRSDISPKTAASSPQT